MSLTSSGAMLRMPISMNELTINPAGIDMEALLSEASPIPEFGIE